MADLTADIGAHGTRVDAALDRMYDRMGARVLFVVVAGGTIIGLVTGLVGLAWACRYLGLSAKVYLETAAVLVASAPPGVWLLATQSDDLLGPGVSWTGGGRTRERAPEVWDSLVRFPYAAAARSISVTCLALVPLTAFEFTVLTDKPAIAAIPFYAAGVASLLASGVLWTFGAELMLRPMVREVAAYLPSDFEPTARSWHLRAKALAPLPVVTMFGALTAGAFVDAAALGAPRLALALGITAATMLAASLVFFVVTRSVLDPLDELSAATRRVRKGDFATAVPVITADELGQLAHSFNLMMDGLQERERLAVENVALLEEVRASRVRIVAASDAERRRVERNIHDGAQQQLVALAVKLRLIEDRVAEDPELHASVVQAGERLSSALRELRELARGLHPSVLSTDGLPAAIEQLAAHAPVPVTINAGEERFPETVESTAYFVACEALANVAKYARASRAEVSVARRDGRLVVQVVDDGIGGAHAEPESGLTGLRDRVAALDGRLTIDSAPGQGTKVIAELPL